MGPKPERTPDSQLTDAQLKARRTQDAAREMRKKVKAAEREKTERLEKMRNENPKQYVEKLLLEKQEITN
jgi:hypothetical protein